MPIQLTYAFTLSNRVPGNLHIQVINVQILFDLLQNIFISNILGTCWCVNIATGEEVHGTRKLDGEVIHCNREYHLNVIIIPNTLN